MWGYVRSEVGSVLEPTRRLLEPVREVVRRRALVEHGGVVNLLHGTTERYPQQEPWVVGLSTSYVFDVFVHVLFNAIGVRFKSA